MIAVLLFLFAPFVYAESAVFELGGESGWGLLQYTENIQTSAGKYGNNGICLRSTGSKVTSKTDMYISFDAPTIVEESGAYTVSSSNMHFADDTEAKLGLGAGFCNPHTKKTGLILKPKKNAFFAGGRPVGSFTIEFWIAPSVAENGSVILQWQSSYIEQKALMDQYIIAQILQNKMEWTFSNIWKNQYGKNISIALKSKSHLIPEQWSHHLVSYDEETGLLEYRMNGYSESIVYVTENGRESDDILPSWLGNAADVSVGMHYAGLIDELKVTCQFTDPKSFTERSALFDKYNPNGGRFESLIFDSGGSQSEIQKLNVSLNTPYQTDAVFFVRAGENKYRWTENNPPWKPVKNGEPISALKGRFFQIAGELYPDADGQKSPLIHSIELKYDKDSLPLPPAHLFAVAHDGCIDLSWTSSADFDVKGYMIYYGNKKGEYFGENSPINVGDVLSYRVPQLKNGRMYFFTIAAYDDELGKRVGNFSREIWIRPRKE